MNTREAVQAWAQAVLGKNWKATVLWRQGEDVLEIRIHPDCYALVTVTAEAAETFGVAQSQCDLQAEIYAARDQLFEMLEGGD